MRIGILTLPLHTNYGGILQAYALQTILERIGHKVVYFNINNTSCKPLILLPFIIPIRIWKRFVLGRIDTALLPERRIKYIYPIIKKYTQPFIDKYIKQINIKGVNEISSSDYNAIIVGSDQIWRPSYYPYIENAFLDFTKGWSIKRLVYAASFGVDYWEFSEQQTIRCKELIKNFDYISIREKSGITLCKEKFNIEAELMIDPTCLLTKDDYVSLIKDQSIYPIEGNLMACILDETDEKHKIVSFWAKQRRLIPFRINADPDNKKKPLKKRIQPPVEIWIKGFMDADFIVTDSYHGCIFSLIFNKPFIVIGNKNRGNTRFDSLLELFGLSHLLVYDVEDCHKLNPSFDFNKINVIMNNFRTRGINMLSQQLNK